MANGPDPKPRPQRGIRPGAGSDRTVAQEHGLEGTILSRLVERILGDVAEFTRPARERADMDNLGQFLRDIAFLPGPPLETTVPASPAALALAQELRVDPGALRARTNPPLFNERARQGIVDFSRIFKQHEPSSEELMSQGADATMVARSRLLERVAAQTALENLLRPKAKVADQ